jgi:hypothetical protein
MDFIVSVNKFFAVLVFWIVFLQARIIFFLKKMFYSMICWFSSSLINN